MAEIEYTGCTNCGSGAGQIGYVREADANTEEKLQHGHLCCGCYIGRSPFRVKRVYLYDSGARREVTEEEARRPRSSLNE